MSALVGDTQVNKFEQVSSLGHQIPGEGGRGSLCSDPCAVKFNFSLLMVTWDLRVDRITDRHDWEHYLPTTSLAGGNKSSKDGCQRRPHKLHLCRPPFTQALDPLLNRSTSENSRPKITCVEVESYLHRNSRLHTCIMVSGLPSILTPFSAADIHCTSPFLVM